MACATTRCRGVPSASYTVALSKEPERPDIRNTSPPAPLAAYASTMSSALGGFALVPARGCPPQLLTSALRSEASGRRLEVAFAFGSVPKLESMQKAESRTTTSPPRTERVAVATTLPPTTSSSLASGRPSVAIVVALSAASTLPSSRFDPSSSSLSSL